jgi:hypothetical protein
VSLPAREALASGSMDTVNERLRDKVRAPRAASDQAADG